MSHPKKRSEYFILLVIISISLLIFVLRDQLSGFENLGYFGIFLTSLLGNATIILPMPTFLAALAGGNSLNPILTGLIMGIGASLGEITGYLLGSSSREIVTSSKYYAPIHRFMDRFGLLAIFLLAAVPNPLFDIAGIIAGQNKIPLNRFLLFTWAGKTLKFLSLAYLGSKLIL